METILMSIHPKWCERIFNGEKTIEVRKSAPKPPFKVVVYCTKGKPNLFIPQEYNCFQLDEASQPYFSEEPILQECDNWANGKAIGEFICDKVSDLLGADAETEKQTCLTMGEMFAYAKGKPLKGLHISALKIYDKPKELGEFYSIKQCKPAYSPFGYQWTWEDRHKRNTGGWDKEYRPVPIECHRCKSLVGGKDYFDEKSGCILFDYECISNYHKPLARPPQSYMRIEEDTI
jgi:predicted transcriptional regulator